MDDKARQEILKPKLKREDIPLSSLKNGYIFYAGTWWKITNVGFQIELREATAQEGATKILNHPGIRILEALAGSQNTDEEYSYKKWIDNLWD